jgi:hypothetical protein
MCRSLPWSNAFGVNTVNTVVDELNAYDLWPIRIGDECELDQQNTLTGYTNLLADK